MRTFSGRTIALLEGRRSGELAAMVRRLEGLPICAPAVRERPSTADAAPLIGRVMAGEPEALVDQVEELRECGVEHLVLEFLAADGRELEEQMTIFADAVRPRVA